MTAVSCYELDHSYLLDFEPALSQEELASLPNPYIGKILGRRFGDCSDAPVTAGWSQSSVVEIDPLGKSVLALDKHSLRLTSLGDLTDQQREQAIDEVEDIEYFELQDYLGKLAKNGMHVGMRQLKSL